MSHRVIPPGRAISALRKAGGEAIEDLGVKMTKCGHQARVYRCDKNRVAAVWVVPYTDKVEVRMWKEK